MNMTMLFPKNSETPNPVKTAFCGFIIPNEKLSIIRDIKIKHKNTMIRIPNSTGSGKLSFMLQIYKKNYQ